MTNSLPIKEVDTKDLDEVVTNLAPLWENFRLKKIYITGGTGFFGKWLVQVFIRANEQLSLNLQLIVLMRNAQKSIKEQLWLSKKFIHIVEGDVRTFQFNNESFDYFIHAATAASATLNEADPNEMADTIIEGTKRVLSLARRSQVPKFLFVSSGAVYGSQPSEILHMPEQSHLGPDITNTANAYAEAKRMAEIYCQFAHKRKVIDLKIARCYAFLGPYLPLDQHFAAGNFINDYLNDQVITLNGDGKPYRSYMYPTDLIEWLITILVRGQSGEAYNVGSDEEVQLAEFARAIDSEKKGVKILGLSSNNARRQAYVPSIQKSRSALGLTIR
ncbi:MAG: NAD-dependent epimerase/dehydratase family protein, partial [Bdellovibrionales bacterium]